MDADQNDSDVSAILKVYLALAAAAAVAIGLALPIPHKTRAPPKSSQIATFDVGRG